jgi:hypothetical protein
MGTRLFEEENTMITLQQLKDAHPLFFDPETVKFFGDVEYHVLEGKATGSAFLVRQTWAWSGLLGGERFLHYRVNPINPDLKIKEMVKEIFRDLNAVKEFLETQ